MKTFTYQIQTGSDETSWRTDDALHIANLDDGWWAFDVAKQASTDHEKCATDDAWRVVVWVGDLRGELVRKPDDEIRGTDLAGDCWCSTGQLYSGHYEWHCPSHGDRSWRPEAKAFQAGCAR